MAEDVFCNQCGHRNAPGSNFCSSCGAGLYPSAGSDRNTTTVNFIPEIEGDDEVPVELGDLGYRWDSYGSAVKVAVVRGNAVVTVEVDSGGSRQHNGRIAE